MSILRLAVVPAVAAALLAAALAGCSGPAAPAGQTFVDKDQGYTISCSGEWRQYTGGFGNDLELMPVNQTDPNVFRDTLMVHVEMLAQPMTLDELFLSKEAAAAKALPEYEYKELDRNSILLGNLEGRRMIYTMIRDDVHVTSVAWFFLKGNRAYTILATAANSRYSALKPKFDDVVNTFKLETP
jgi:hypothetical protein